MTHADEQGTCAEPRRGERLALFAVRKTCNHDGHEYTLRWVMRVIECGIDTRGLQVLVSEIETEGRWNRLKFDEETIIALYPDHGNSEQYQSELQTGFEIERLPFETSATNVLIPRCPHAAYNILRWLGRNGLLGSDAPPRHRAKRRRIRTVIQEPKYRAARLIRDGPR